MGNSAIIDVGGGSSGGGLPKRGVYKNKINLQEGIYTLNASDGSFIATLPKADNLQRRIRITLSEVSDSNKINMLTQTTDKIFNPLALDTQELTKNRQIIEYDELEDKGWQYTIINKGVVLSSRIGEFVYASINKPKVQGMIEVVPKTIPNGAVNYPVWASMYPMFVSGNDIVFPSNVAGIFLRNSRDGNQGFENWKTGINRLSISSNQTNIFSSTDNSGSNNYMLPKYGGRSWQISAVNVSPKLIGKVDETLDDMYINPSATHSHSISGGDSETSPVNYKFRLYTIVDNYID